jgi:hypothetical protein
VQLGAIDAHDRGEYDGGSLRVCVSVEGEMRESRRVDAGNWFRYWTRTSSQGASLHAMLQSTPCPLHMYRLDNLIQHLL